MRRSASNYRQPDNWPTSPLLEAGAEGSIFLLVKEDQAVQGKGNKVNIP